MFFHRFRNRVGAVIESHIRITVPTGQGEGDGRTINLHLRRDHKRNSLDPDILLGIDADDDVLIEVDRRKLFY